MYPMWKFGDYLIELEQLTEDGCMWNMEKLRDDAPEEAINAFEKYKKELEEAAKPDGDFDGLHL